MARILIVDDDVSLRRGVATLVAALGHQTVEASDAQEALKAARADRPDLIILDVQMPAGGGPLVHRVLSESPELAAIPLILCSGMPLPQMRQWFPERAGLRYHPKPMRAQILQQQLNELLPRAG